MRKYLPFRYVFYPWVLQFLLIPFQAKPGELLISGIYQGKDLFVRNPHSEDGQRLSIRKIYLNEKLVIEEPESSTCRIGLSALKIGDPVNVRIIYSEGLAPEFINPQVVREKSLASFHEINVDGYGITWKMTDLAGRTLIFIEKRTDNHWEILSSLEVYPEGEMKEYGVSLHHGHGLNEYRIKAVCPDASVVYSGIIMFRSEKNQLTFYPKRASTKITLMGENEYEILDIQGHSLFRGKDHEISVEDLSPGIYYLVIGDQIEKFINK